MTGAIIVGSAFAVAIVSTVISVVSKDKDTRPMFLWSALSLFLSGSIQLWTTDKAAGAMAFVSGLVGAVAFVGGLFSLRDQR